MSYCCPIQNTTSSGGAVCGGSAIVEVVGDAWDGFAAVWPLNETGMGDPDEYVDRSRNLLHAQGGDGSDIELVPLPEEGVFCQPSQKFQGRQFITVPPDRMISTQGFSVSCWARIDTYYTPRVFFSRGHDTTEADSWVFTFGHSFLNQVQASIHTRDSAGVMRTFVCDGSTLLTRNQWYHFAASWEPGVGLKAYVNGVHRGALAVTETTTAPLTNEGYFSKWNRGAWITGNIQDVRLHPVVRNAAWFLAEFQNYCLPGFFTVGEEES